MKAPVILLFLAFVVMQCRSQQSGGAEVTLENTYWRLVMVEGKKVGRGRMIGNKRES